jgi:hypothetical protein
MTIAQLLALAWARREYAVATGTAFLVAYFTASESFRTRLETRFPRWRAVVGLLRDVLPFLPGVPSHLRALVSGTHADAPPAPVPSRADELDLRAAAIPAPAPIAPASPMRAVTVTGRALSAEEEHAAVRAGVHRELGLAPFDPQRRQVIAPDVRDALPTTTEPTE